MNQHNRVFVTPGRIMYPGISVIKRFHWALLMRCYKKGFTTKHTKGTKERMERHKENCPERPIHWPTICFYCLNLFVSFVRFVVTMVVSFQALMLLS
jgi:hypothetical protein